MDEVNGRVERKAVWRVEWKNSRHPNQFKLFAAGKSYPSEALASYNECLQRPGCIEARIVQRNITTEINESVIDPEELRGKI